MSISVKPYSVISTKLNDTIDIKSELADVKHQNNLFVLVKEFEDLIAHGTKIKCVTTGELFIRLSDDTPIVRSPYRMSAQEREIVKEIIQDLMENGIFLEFCRIFRMPIRLRWSLKKIDNFACVSIFVH